MKVLWGSLGLLPKMTRLVDMPPKERNRRSPSQTYNIILIKPPPHSQVVRCGPWIFSPRHCTTEPPLPSSKTILNLLNFAWIQQIKQLPQSVNKLAYISCNVRDNSYFKVLFQSVSCWRYVYQFLMIFLRHQVRWHQVVHDPLLLTSSTTPTNDMNDSLSAAVAKRM